jgi:hypothetical protein
MDFNKYVETSLTVLRLASATIKANRGSPIAAQAAAASGLFFVSACVGKIKRRVKTHTC